jgi:hypothetical protein
MLWAGSGPAVRWAFGSLGDALIPNDMREWR